MKNIAIITTTLNKGGAERVAANLSLEFEKFYNVYLIVLDGTNIKYPYGGTLIDLKLPPSKSIIGKIKTLLKRIHALKKLKKIYKIEYSISHLPSCNYINVFSKKKDKIFCYVHSMLKADVKTIIRERIISYFSDKIICVSECVRQNMIKKFKIKNDKVITIYNFCPEIELSDVAKNEKESIMVVNMGRLAQPKGQWHLIRAMHYVVERNSNVKLKIIGEGQLREKLEKLISKLNLEKNIELCGFIDNPFLELCKCDIYVSSSLWEGLPMALVEAGMCKLPIISTDCDAGCREILSPNTAIDKKTDKIEEATYGILVPICKSGNQEQKELTNEEIELAKAILLLVNDKEKRKKYANLAEKRAKDFLPETIMKKWSEIII